MGEERSEPIKKNDSQGDGINPYIVVEESHSLSPMVLDRGCISLDEIGYEDGQPLPLLIGSLLRTRVRRARPRGGAPSLARPPRVAGPAPGGFVDAAGPIIDKFDAYG